MNLQNINPALLSPNPWNTNQVAPDEMEKLTASLERHGWVRPILARETEDGLQILGGQHRVEAAGELGHDTVPVVNLGRISDVKAKEIGLIDNARYGQDDAIGLAELIADLGGTKAISSFLPFDDAELAALSTEIGDDEIENLLEENDSDPNPDDAQKKSAKTHQMMRFKVPIKDADSVQGFIETVMSAQGFDDGDSLTNAGDALVHVAQTFVSGDPDNV